MISHLTDDESRRERETWAPKWELDPRWVGTADELEPWLGRCQQGNV